MNYLNGGYVMLDKADSDIFAKASGALKAGKPILWYENSTTCYFIDTIEKTGTDTIALTKGGLTIVVTSGNVVTEIGTTNGAVLDDIVDANGNNRFVEDDGVGLELEGLNITYNKWSLSGTHLMFVLAGTVANTTEISDSVTLSAYEIPKWIFDKIYATWDTNKIESKTLTMVADDWSTQTMTATLLKGATKINIIKSGGGSVTLTKNRAFRIQFDLLIDNSNE